MFLDNLYLVLRERADRREKGADRRLLDRGDGRERRLQSVETPAGTAAAVARRSDARRYLLAAFLATVAFMTALAIANYRLAPQLFSRAYLAEMASQMTAGFNYGLFDLNFDIRGFRHEHIKRMPEKPEVVVLGASHWQEAHGGLVPGRRFYNAHVHRDYYEDLLAVVEMLIRYDRLPNVLVLSIRDLTFAPVASRQDYLWLTGLADYRAMAARLGVRAPAGNCRVAPLDGPRLATGSLEQCPSLGNRCGPPRAKPGGRLLDDSRSVDAGRLDPLVGAPPRPVHASASSARGRRGGCRPA